MIIVEHNGSKSTQDYSDHTDQDYKSTAIFMYLLGLYIQVHRGYVMCTKQDDNDIQEM